MGFGLIFVVVVLLIFVLAIIWAISATIKNSKRQKVYISTNNLTPDYHYNNVQIAVLKGQEPDFATISIGEKVNLVQEPDNPYDSKAIAIFANDGNRLGYVYRGNMQEMINDFLNRNGIVIAEISDINFEEYQLYINLSFYR